MTIKNDRYYLNKALDIFDIEVKDCTKNGCDFVCLRDEAVDKINRIFLFTGARRNLIMQEFFGIVRRTYPFENVAIWKGDGIRISFQGFVGYFKNPMTKDRIADDEDPRQV